MAITETTTTFTTFPVKIAYGATVGPKYKTTVFEATSGAEQRNSLWVNGRIAMNVGTGITTDVELSKVISHFRNMKGRAYAFRIRDWSDYTLTNEIIGTGDGSTTAFQITKKYIDGSSTYTRTINLIVPGTISVTVGGTANTDFNLDVDTGVITFTSAPAASADIAVTCEFDIKARYDTDVLEMNLQAYKLGSSTINIIEVFD